MKIILTSSMSGLGGTENATFRLARLLHEHGHKIILASSDGPLVQDVKDLRIAWRNIDFYQNGKIGYLKAAWFYAKLLMQEKPDIIHCQMARIVPACAIAAKVFSPETKVFYHARGLNPETYPKIAKLFDKLGVYIIGNCRHEQAKLIRHGFPTSRITYTYNALPKLEHVPQKSERNHVVLGTLSRLDKVRAVNLTLDIFKILTDRGLDVRLKIAGIGEETDNLKQQAKDLGIDDKVTFLGGIRDLNAYFKEIDILVNTLDCEGDHGAGVGNNILEAGLYETAVVSYAVIGIPEMVVNGETGFCTPLRDQQAFADAVEKLVRDKNMRTEMGKALKHHVEKLCSDEKIYHTTLAAYRM